MGRRFGARARRALKRGLRRLSWRSRAQAERFMGAWNRRRRRVGLREFQLVQFPDERWGFEFKPTDRAWMRARVGQIENGVTLTTLAERPSPETGSVRYD